MISGVCSFQREDTKWTCSRCLRSVTAKSNRPPKRRCVLCGVASASQACPLAHILYAAPATADPAAYVARLHRCLAAGCSLIHRVDSRILCVGRGRSCQWLGEWARFLAGGDECPHWGESTTASPTPPATPQPPP